MVHVLEQRLRRARCPGGRVHHRQPEGVALERSRNDLGESDRLHARVRLAGTAEGERVVEDLLHVPVETQDARQRRRGGVGSLRGAVQEAVIRADSTHPTDGRLRDLALAR